jgi:hypothetical protein
MAKMKIFSFMALEMLQILRDAYNVAKNGGHELHPPVFLDLLKPYDLVKRILQDKKD